MRRIVNFQEAKARLTALIAAVEAGERVVIARDGKPAVELVPHRAEAIDRTPGALAGDPAWRAWKHDPAVFAPLATDEELDAHGWPRRARSPTPARWSSSSRSRTRRRGCRTPSPA